MKARRFVTFALLVVTAVSGGLLAQAPQAVGTWAPAGTVASGLPNGAAVTLPDGRTLITGGMTAEGVPTARVVAFNPADNSVEDAGTLAAPRSGHTATLLADGRVLIVGGLTDSDLLSADIEVFDPTTSASTLVSQLPEPRMGHVAAQLFDGTVLIAGGKTTDDSILRTAVLFDVETATVTPVAGQLQAPRTNASATTMLDGRVLIAGGSNGTTDLASAEIYERFSQTFNATATQMSMARQGHAAVLLPHNGGVLITGGTSNGAAQADADLFLPAVFPDPFSYGEGQFTATGAMGVPRSRAIAGPMTREGFAFAAGGGSPDSEAYRFATITTDTDDYAPGQLAVITGSGWRPGEEVTLLFQEDPAVHEDYVLKVTADSAGNIFWNQWAPGVHDLGVRFYLTATDSKSHAQTTFTDAADTDTTLRTTPNPSAPGDSVTATASVTSAGAPVTQGLVKFYFGGANCTGNPGTQFGAAAGVALNASGQASAATTLLTNGAIVRACYLGFGSGSSALQASSATVTQTVTTSVATTTVVSSSSNPSTFGGNITFSAVVSRTSGSGTPTGSVQFRIDGVDVGTAVSLGSPSSSTSATATSPLITTLTAGTHTVDATYIPIGNFLASSDTLDGGQVVNKANAVCTITGFSGNYDSTPHGASGSCAGVAGDAAAAGSSLTLGATFTNAPGGTSNWSFTGGANYNDQSGSVAITINKATAVCTVTGYTGTYDTAAHGATGSCIGVGSDSAAAGSSLSLGASFTNVPGGTAHWSFTGGSNYNDQSGSVAITIDKADAVCSISGYTGAYDAASHGASGSCIGVGVDTAAAGSSLNLGATFTNVPGGTANWSFTGGANYKDQSGDAAIVINKVDAVCTISGYTGIYDASSHGASGSCAGITADPSAGGSSLSLGAAFTDVPGGTAQWSFTGGANYNDQSGSVAIVISKANASCAIVGYSGIYDGLSHGATGSCVGVNNGSTAGATLDLGAGYMNVPGGTATWTFNGGNNYNDQSGSVDIAISKANAVCTIAGYTGIYDGHAHGASGSCSGADNGAAAGSTLDLGASFINVPGGTATWAFHGGNNYNDQGGSVAITISKAEPVVNVVGYSGVYDAQPHGASGTATGVLKEALAGLSLGATFTNYPGGTAHWVFTDATGNYNDASGDVAISISKANATITVNGYTGTYDAQPHGAVGSATGVGGVDLSAGLNLGSGLIDVPGGTAHWTFTGGLNYNDASGTVAIVINRANATCTVVGYDVIYDGVFHTATGSCAGVKGAALSGLNLGGTTHKDAGDYVDTWTFVDVTGNYNGSTGTVGDKIRHWTTDGFYKPVDMSGSLLVWNIIKGGSTVPLKFNLLAGTEKKTSVGDVKGFAVAEMPCAVSSFETTVDFTTTGGTQLRYDGTAGQFIQNWQTPNTSGKCFMVRLTAQDGSTIDAYFKTK